jgi:hypothetical protein
VPALVVPPLDVEVAAQVRVVEGIRPHRESLATTHDGLATLEFLEAEVDPGAAQRREGALDAVAAHESFDVTGVKARVAHQR